MAFDITGIDEITTTGSVLVGDTANTKSTLGLTINQGAADDEIASLKSSDVGHGVTTITETDTFGFAKKVRAANGGLQICGLDASQPDSALLLEGIQGTTVDTLKSTSGKAVVRLGAYIKSGTGVTSVGANGNLLTVENNATTRFIFDADGDSHQDVGTAWTNF